MTARRGLLVVELMVAMVIFTVGLLSVTLSLTYGVRLIKESGDTTTAEQTIVNSFEKHLMDRILNGDSAAAPAGDGVTQLSDRTIEINGKNIRLNCYRYKPDKKRAAPLYIVERSN